MGWIYSPSLEIKWEQRRNVTQRPLPGVPTVGVLTRWSGTNICCSTGASQGGLDLAVALPLWDAQRCRLRLFNQH